MKRMAAIIFSVFMLLLCACGGKEGTTKKTKELAGTWRSSDQFQEYTYEFRENGTYRYTTTGTVAEHEMEGSYTFDGERVKLDDGKVMEYRDCCLVSRGSASTTKYGKSYDKQDDCPQALKDMLGPWFVEGTTVQLYLAPSGNYTLYTTDGRSSGVYIYDPVEQTVELPGADRVFKYEKLPSGKETLSDGLTFSR